MLRHDFRHGTRLLSRQPGLTAVAIVSLAIGIGANAALVSLLDGLGLRPLPVPRAGRLVRIFTSRPPNTYGDSSFADYRAIAEETTAFERVAAYGTRAVAVTGADGTSDVAILGVVSGNYFATLGVHASVGRTLDERDDAESELPAAMISDRLWQRRYQRDPEVAGRAIVLNRHAAFIAGVLPARFSGLEPLVAPDVWIAPGAVPPLLGTRAELQARDNRWFKLVARLREDATFERASTQVAAVMSRLAEAYPATNSGRGGFTAFEDTYRERVARVAGLIFGSIGACVLLLACVNVAALLLAAAEERRYEMAVRGAVGGTRAQLVRQLLVESMMLAALSGAAGLALAWIVIRSLPAMVPPSPLPLALAFRMDARVVWAAALFAAVTVFAFGLAPALSGSKADLGLLLKAHSPGLRGRSRVRRAMVAGQIAISFALLTTSVLLVRSVRALEAIDPGFAVRPMLIVAVSPGAAGYSEQAGRQYYQSALAGLGALPGIEAVSLAKRPPLSLYGGGATEIVNVDGQAAPEHEPGFRIHFNIVGPDYFDTMGGALIRGRDFDASDGSDRERVAIISEAMARRFWRDGDALGRQIAIGERRTACRIVGIARDGKYNSLTEHADPYIYFPLSQRYTGEAAFIVRTQGDERGAISAVRAALAAIDKSVPALQVMTIGSQLRLATFAERTTAALVSALGALCLFLSMVGLYGLASYLARRGARDIGVRVALGARSRDVAVGLLAQLGRPIATGLSAGLVLSFLLGRLTAASLYGVSASDFTTYATAASVLVAVAVAALLMPALRAARTDPASVLRAE